MMWKAVVLLASAASGVVAEKEPLDPQATIIYEHYGKLKHFGDHKPEHHDEYAWAYPSYEFSYKVEDPHTHDFKGQNEIRHGDKVMGEYWLYQPDGRKRTVKYHDDGVIGFQAHVEYSHPHNPMHRYDEEHNKPVEQTVKRHHEYDKKQHDELNSKPKSKYQVTMHHEYSKPVVELQDEEDINAQASQIASVVLKQPPHYFARQRVNNVNNEHIFNPSQDGNLLATSSQHNLYYTNPSDYNGNPQLYRYGYKGGDNRYDKRNRDFDHNDQNVGRRYYDQNRQYGYNDHKRDRHYNDQNGGRHYNDQNGGRHYNDQNGDYYYNDQNGGHYYNDQYDDYDYRDQNEDRYYTGQRGNYGYNNQNVDRRYNDQYGDYGYNDQNRGRNNKDQNGTFGYNNQNGTFNYNNQNGTLDYNNLNGSLTYNNQTGGRNYKRQFRHRELDYYHGRRGYYSSVGHRCSSCPGHQHRHRHYGRNYYRDHYPSYYESDYVYRHRHGPQYSHNKPYSHTPMPYQDRNDYRYY